MSEPNPNARLEAFCDGVFAIALTLLIIDIKIHSPEQITGTPELWSALIHITPSIFAFVFSFTIILITWVNHHNGLKLVNKSSVGYLYANGLLLLSVAFIPFPTSLLGEYLLTDHAAPAVILYVSVMAFQSVGWVVMCNVALKDRLAKDEKSSLFIRENRKYGIFAFVLYSVCAVIAIWFPLTIALFTNITWIFWLIRGIQIKHG